MLVYMTLSVFELIFGIWLILLPGLHVLNWVYVLVCANINCFGQTFLLDPQLLFLDPQ